MSHSQPEARYYATSDKKLSSDAVAEKQPKLQTRLGTINATLFRMTEMTRQVLKDICKEHQLYVTPQLNDKLYCNYKGFGSISNLEPYTGLKALFLEGNALDSLQGLPKLEELKCL